MSKYIPSQEILDKYADVLVNFALGGGKGIVEGDVVSVHASESAKPLYAAVLRAVTKAGGHTISRYSPDNDSKFNFSRDYYEAASDEQLDFFPEAYLRGFAETIDHSLHIISTVDPHALEGVDAKRIMRSGVANKPFSDWMDEKENRGKYTWTIALYGTEAMAAEAEMSLQEYWRQIIDACFLEENDPIAKWQEVSKEIDAYKDKLNALKIERLHVVGDDMDLWVQVGEKHKWCGGGGANIPSFEIFTSPDWRGTEGWICFNQPLYRYGNIIKGIKLEFKNGRVIKATARENEQVLKEMIATPGADKLGEFSLTDARHSKITKFMAETLFDENMGGKYGNTHVAVGNSYHDCFDGDPAVNDKEDWEGLGFNDSSVHTDMVSTTDRVVTAVLVDGTTKVIYEHGRFQV